MTRTTGAPTPAAADVAVLFAEVLDRPEVTPDDDFFALGGQSVQAAGLFARLEERFGVDLPITALLDAPTPSALAAYIREGRGADAWDRLVRIRPLPDGVPLFGIHGVLGNALNVERLARHLPEGRPVYGIQAAGLDGRRLADVTIGELGRSYVLDVRRARPSGPYLLYGFSFGGLVALEMGRVLRAQGEEVLVLLGDTSVPGRTDAATAGLAARHRLHRLNLRSRPGGRGLLEYVRWRLRERVRRHVEGLVAAVLLRVGRPLPPTLRRAQLLRVHTAAANAYQAHPYDGPVVLFRSEVEDTPDRGWADVLTGPFEVVNVPGAHNDMMREPFVASFAEILATAVEGWPDGATASRAG